MYGMYGTPSGRFESTYTERGCNFCGARTGECGHGAEIKPEFYDLAGAKPEYNGKTAKPEHLGKTTTKPECFWEEVKPEAEMVVKPGFYGNTVKPENYGCE